MRGRGGALPSPWSPSLGLDPRCLPGTVGMNLVAYAGESPARWQVQNSKQRAVVRGPVDECPQGLALGERSGQRGKEKAHYTQIFNSMLKYLGGSMLMFTLKCVKKFKRLMGGYTQE